MAHASGLCLGLEAWACSTEKRQENHDVIPEFLAIIPPSPDFLLLPQTMKWGI